MDTGTKVTMKSAPMKRLRRQKLVAGLGFAFAFALQPAVASEDSWLKELKNVLLGNKEAPSAVPIYRSREPRPANNSGSSPSSVSQAQVANRDIAPATDAEKVKKALLGEPTSEASAVPQASEPANEAKSETPQPPSASEASNAPETSPKPLPKLESRVQNIIDKLKDALKGDRPDSDSSNNAESGTSFPSIGRGEGKKAPGSSAGNPSASGSSTAAHGKMFSISNTVTANSVLRFEGKIPSGFDSIVIYTKNSRNPSQEIREQHFVSTAGGLVGGNTYLRAGAGDYTMMFATCTTTPANCTYADQFSVRNTDTADHSYLLPSTTINSDDPEIQALALQLTAGLTNDLDKSRAIHEWVAKNIIYDASGYFDNSYLNKKYDAVNILRIRVSVCLGYANLSAALHRAAGIRAKVIEGIGKPLEGIVGPAPQDGRPNHAWNLVLIDGNWLPQDPTWDSGYIERETQKFVSAPRLKYFEMTQAEFDIEHQAIREREN